MNLLMGKESSRKKDSVLSDFGKRLQVFDLFGERVPSFNLGGESEIKTAIGGFVSLLVSSVTIIFASLKWQHLLEYKSPSITTYS